MLIYLNRKLYKKIQVNKEIQVNNIDETLQYTKIIYKQSLVQFCVNCHRGGRGDQLRTARGRSGLGVFISSSSPASLCTSSGT